MEADKGSLLTSTTGAVLGSLPWLSNTRESLRSVMGTGEHFRHCQKLLDSDS